MTGIHDNVETYEPKVDVTYENSIPKVDTSFDDITDDNGNINIIINSEVIGQTLAKKIYTSWTSGLRELYNNEARACRTAKKMGGNPSIVITIDPNESNRQVIIQGVDSLGITKAMFNKVLRVIGTSGNTDGEEIGQYGMGFIAYALMTDALLLETWSRETEEHYAMLCDSGLKFKPIPLEENNNINTMSEYGTKLTMTCNNDVDFSELVHNVAQLARFSNVPTKMILLDNIVGYSDYYGRNDKSYDKGVLECDSYDNGMDYLKSRSSYEYLKNTSHQTSEPVMLYDEITIDNEDYRFDGLLIINKTRYGGVNIKINDRNVKMLLVGTHIDSEIRVNGMANGIINVKNERKYSPVASRDSLDSKARDTLEEQLKADLTEYLSKYNIEDVDEYNSSLHKCVLAQDPMYELKGYLSRGSNEISRTLNTRYSTPNKSHSSLNEMLSTGGTIIALKSLRSNLMDLLTDNISGSVQFFRIPTRLTDEEKGHRIALFKELNIILGEEYKKQQQLKETRGKNTITKNGKTETYSGDRSIILYNSGRGTVDGYLWGSTNGWRSGSEKYSTTINDVNENYHSNCLVVDRKNWDNIMRLINGQACDWKMMHDMKGISPKVMTLNKLTNKVGKKMYQTNDGLVKGSDLNGEYNVVVMKDIELLDDIKDEKESRIIGVKNINEYVALMCYRSQISEELTFNNDSRGDTFENITRCDINIRNESYNFDKGNDVARIYWIEKLLPDIYADIFTHAMMYDRENLDKIEIAARQLNEVLKQ